MTRGYDFVGLSGPGLRRMNSNLKRLSLTYLTRSRAVNFSDLRPKYLHRPILGQVVHRAKRCIFSSRPHRITPCEIPRVIGSLDSDDSSDEVWIRDKRHLSWFASRASIRIDFAGLTPNSALAYLKALNLASTQTQVKADLISLQFCKAFSSNHASENLEMLTKFHPQPD